MFSLLNQKKGTIYSVNEVNNVFTTIWLLMSSPIKCYCFHVIPMAARLCSRDCCLPSDCDWWADGRASSSLSQSGVFSVSG